MSGVELDTIVTVSSAAVSLLGAIVAGAMANRSARQTHELEMRKKEKEQHDLAEHILAQYRDPLLDAAHTLQARLFNIVAQDYLGKYLHCGDPDEENYARDYTVYAMAEYLCWVEIIRRELRFHDLGDDDRTRKVLGHLTLVQLDFQGDKVPAQFRVFRGRQRAIAELMMVPTNAAEGPRSECMGYAAFCRRLADDRDFAGWFASLREDVDAVAAHPEDSVRLSLIQRDLIGLIDQLDPQAVRLPKDLRHRLPEPALPADHQPKRVPV